MRMSRVLFLSRVLLLEAQQEQTSKLRIFLIKLSHSSSTYENTFAFQHFIDRRKTIIFGLKERAQFVLCEMFDCPCTAQFCIEIAYSNRFRLKNKNKKPCAVLDFAHLLGPETGY